MSFIYLTLAGFRMTGITLVLFDTVAHDEHLSHMNLSVLEGIMTCNESGAQ